MSCREYDGKTFITVDILYDCYTEVHIQFVGFFVIPFIVLIGFFF